jgi:hypothetical protein
MRGKRCERISMTTRFLRALVFCTWIYSFILWLYIVARIIISGVDVHWPFVDSIQSISISEMGIITFGLSFLSMAIYFTYWGKLPWTKGPSS